MAVCVAVLARQNYPLYMRTVPNDNNLKFQFIVHSSLDVIEEKMTALTRSAAEASTRESYLGYLLTIQDFNVYGYVTKCHVKFVVLMESSNLSVKDHDIQAAFKKLHQAYSEAASNPFYNNGDPIRSTAFDKVVSSVLAANTSSNSSQLSQAYQNQHTELGAS